MLRNKIVKAFTVIDKQFKNQSRSGIQGMKGLYKSIKNPKTEGAAFTKQLLMGFGIISVGMIASLIGLR
jgi:hypothetical protein